MGAKKGQAAAISRWGRELHRLWHALLRYGHRRLLFSPSLPADDHPAHTPLIDGSDVSHTISRYTEYPELFVRWFEWGAFQPVMRGHGERDHNEVWVYGKQAEPILAEYLRLHYQLLPYTYSLGYGSDQTGAPFMRALFMDSPTTPTPRTSPTLTCLAPRSWSPLSPSREPPIDRCTCRPAAIGTTTGPANGSREARRSPPMPPSTPFRSLSAPGSPFRSDPPFSPRIRNRQLPRSRLPRRQRRLHPLLRRRQHDAYEKGAGSLTKLHLDDANHRLDHNGASAWSLPDTAVVPMIGK